MCIRDRRKTSTDLPVSDWRLDKLRQFRMMVPDCSGDFGCRKTQKAYLGCLPFLRKRLRSTKYPLKKGIKARSEPIPGPCEKFRESVVRLSFRPDHQSSESEILLNIPESLPVFSILTNRDRIRSIHLWLGIFRTGRQTRIILSSV